LFKCVLGVQFDTMKRFLPILLMLSMVVAAPATAQQLRVGYVDMKQVLDNAPQVLAGREKLDLEFRPRNETIEFQERQVQSMDDRLQRGDLTEDARVRMDRELREMRRNVNRQREDLRDELSFRRTEEVQKLEDQINLAVQEIARNNGYDLILSSPVIYADPALDITQLILDQLRLEYEADKRERSLR
jgi:outer membrane protein